MPKQQLKITKTEYQENLARLSRLKEMGVPTGSVDHPSPEPPRLALKIDHDSARIYELFPGRVAVVVPATIRVLVSGILITDVAVFIPRFDCSLELSDPAENEYYPDLINEFLHTTPTKLLNNLLTSEIPLRPCQRKGVIVADGWTFVPPECPDELPITMELLLRDERLNELCFEFEVRLDRILKLKCERRQQERYERMRSTMGGGMFDPATRTGIFGPKTGQVENQKNVSPKEAINRQEASGEDDRELRKPN
jgi:hypothetical protein